MAKNSWSVREMLFRLEDGSLKSASQFNSYELSIKWKKLEESAMMRIGCELECDTEHVA